MLVILSRCRRFLCRLKIFLLLQYLVLRFLPERIYAFYRLARGLGGQWLAWVATALLITSRGRYRRWARRFSLTAAGELPHKASPEPTGAHAVELLEQAHRLRRHISRLSHKHRAAVVLCDLEGFSVDEAATIAGIKVATLRSRLRDGRRDLRSMLERDPYFSRPPIAGVVK